MSDIPVGSEIVAVVGAGTMGAGITQVAASAGHQTRVYDSASNVVALARESIAQNLNQRIQRGRLSESEADATLSRIDWVESLEDLASAHIVIEAVAEDLAIKQGLLRQLEVVCSPQAVLGTNTSSLSITELGAVLRDPSRLVGMHFFNPAPAMKLVEIILGTATSPDIARYAAHLVKSWGKFSVEAKSTPGFIVNRVARSFYAEALRLVQEQAADVATLDAIMRESGGFKMGPLALMDLIGHDVNFAVTKSVYEAFYQDSRFRPSLVQKALIDAGHLGQKSGRGFFDYSEQASPTIPQQLSRQLAPARIKVCGDLGVASSLRSMWVNAGIDVKESNGESTGRLEFDDIFLEMTDGRTATQRAAELQQNNVILFDLASDFSTCTRIALTRADQSDPDALCKAAGLFQAIGKTVSTIDDVPGMAVMRTVCMLANEGADAVNQGVCSIKAVDLAMRHGTGYPLGPMVWADRIGVRRVADTLTNLRSSYGEDRYRVSPLLLRKSLSGRDFYA